MKLLFITQNLGTLGGVQRVVNTVIDELLNNENYDITVLMPQNKKDFNYFNINNKAKIVNLDLFYNDKKMIFRKVFQHINKKTGCFRTNIFNILNEHLFLSNREKKSIIDFINKQEFDIVISTGDTYSILLGIIAPHINSKTIGWQHSTFESYFRRKGNTSYGLENIAKKSYKKLNEIFVLTNDDKIKFENAFGISCFVLYNPLPKSIKKMSKLNNNTLIFVGRLNYNHKGLNHLVEIIKTVHKKSPNLKCVVVGDGPDRNVLENLIVKNGLTDILLLVGKSDNVYKYYEKSDILLQTSNWEGFGMNIIEAMSCGIPVVSFHNSGPDEIIRDGIDGYLIEKYNIEDFAEKVLFLENNSEIKKKFAKSCIDRAKDFDVKKIIIILENKLKEILK